MKKLLLLIILLTSAPGDANAFTHMHKKHKIDIEGQEREYYEHNPFHKKNQITIIALAAKHKEKHILAQMQFDNLAYKEDILTIYPIPLNDIWNDGTSNNPSSEVDDVLFISNLIDDLVARGVSDPNNIYITGSSNGGNMAYRLACEITTKISAIIPVAAGLPQNYKCSPKGKMALLALNINNDKAIPQETNESSDFISKKETMSLWTKNNDCKGVHLPKILKTPKSKDKSTATVHKWLLCRAMLYDIDYFTKDPTELKKPISERFVWPITTNINTSLIIWTYIQRTHGVNKK